MNFPKKCNTTNVTIFSKHTTKLTAISINSMPVVLKLGSAAPWGTWKVCKGEVVWQRHI